MTKRVYRSYYEILRCWTTESRCRRVTGWSESGRCWRSAASSRVVPCVAPSPRSILPWLPMLALMIGLGFLGTMLGRRLLDRVPEKRFATGFKLMLTALALKIVADGAGLWPL